MAAVSRRILAGATAARLGGIANATGYYGQIGRLLDGTTGHEPPTKSSLDLRVAPYYVLYPGAGHDGPEVSLGDCNDGLTLPITLTAVAGDIDDLLALLDRLDDRLHRWAPVLAGVLCSPLTRPIGWQSPPVLTDTAVHPPRLYTQLEYSTVATT